jgi:hypothetical protein
LTRIKKWREGEEGEFGPGAYYQDVVFWLKKHRVRHTSPQTWSGTLRLLNDCPVMIGLKKPSHWIVAIGADKRHLTYLDPYMRSGEKYRRRSLRSIVSKNWDGAAIALLPYATSASE